MGDLRLVLVVRAFPGLPDLPLAQAAARDPAGLHPNAVAPALRVLVHCLSA